MGWWRRAGRVLYLVCILAALGFANVAAASEYHGQVTFGGLPVPGATVTVTQGTKKLTTVSEQGGIYSFPDLARRTMDRSRSRCSVSRPSTPTLPSRRIRLRQSGSFTLLPLDQIAKLTTLPPAPLPTPLPLRLKRPAPPALPPALNDQPAEIPKPPEDASQQSSDGFLVNGSVNNAATSRFSLDQAFGNRRFNSKESLQRRSCRHPR